MKTYVKVECKEIAKDEYVPCVIYWEDGTKWPINSILHITIGNGTDFEGFRYTILIGSVEKYIYKDINGWYVEQITRSDKIDSLVHKQGSG